MRTINNFVFGHFSRSIYLVGYGTLNNREGLEDFV